MFTRKEYETYEKLKIKILSHEKSTQTDQIITKTNSTTSDSALTDSENDSSDQEESSEEYYNHKRFSRKNGLQPIIILQGLPFNTRNRNVDEDDDDEYEDDEYEDEGEGEESETDGKSASLATDSCNSIDCVNIIDRKRKRSEKESGEKRKKPKNLRERYFPEEIKYYKSLSKKQKEHIEEMETKLIDINHINTPFRFRILESDMDLHLKSIAIQKVEKLNRMDPSSSDYNKMMNWIEHLCKLPIGKYKKLPLNSSESSETISKFLDTTKQNLDAKVFGHVDTKDQIIRLLAKWISNPESKGNIIGIEGPAGVGKTCICNAICESLGLPFGFIQLGGISDGSYLLGHSYTYEGSRWGRIAEILMGSGYMNPVLYFDELDKISKTQHGEEIVNILIHLTDNTQNNKFHDKYYSDIELDLSKCLIVFSYNFAEEISPVLRDRIVTIKANGYKMKDKLKIAKDYMIPLIFKEFSFDEHDIIITDAILQYIINSTDEEQGVRNLKRSLEEVISQLNLHRLLKKNIIDENELIFPLQLTKEIVDKCLMYKKQKNISLDMMYT